MGRTAVCAGVVCALAIAGAGALGWGRAKAFNWFTVHPMWLLRAEVRSEWGSLRTPALDELIRRFEGDPAFEPVVLQELVEEALARQADRSKLWVPEWGDLVEIQWERGDLSDEQKRRYFEGNAEITLRTRASVNEGDPLPLRYRAPGRLATKGRVAITVRHERVWQWPADWESDESFQFGSSGELRRDLLGGGWGISTLLDVKPGRHVLVQRWRTVVYEGKWRTSGRPGSLLELPKDEIIAEWTSTVFAEFEVRPPTNPAVVTYTDALKGEEIARAMRIKIKEDAVGSVPTVEIALNWVERPCQISARGIALCEGRSWSHERYLIHPEGQGQHWIITDWKKGPKAMTLVIACDGRMAKQMSLAVTETWSGILVLEDIPIDGQWHEPGCVTMLLWTDANHMTFERAWWEGFERQRAELVKRAMPATPRPLPPAPSAP